MPAINRITRMMMEISVRRVDAVSFPFPLALWGLKSLRHIRGTRWRNFLRDEKKEPVPKDWPEACRGLSIQLLNHGSLTSELTQRWKSRHAILADSPGRRHKHSLSAFTFPNDLPSLFKQLIGPNVAGGVARSPKGSQFVGSRLCPRAVDAKVESLGAKGAAAIDATDGHVVFASAALVNSHRAIVADGGFAVNLVRLFGRPADAAFAREVMQFDGKGVQRFVGIADKLEKLVVGSEADLFHPRAK